MIKFRFNRFDDLYLDIPLYWDEYSRGTGWDVSVGHTPYSIMCAVWQPWRMLLKLLTLG